MPNPAPAYRGSQCDNCESDILEGDSVFFDEGNKLCESCASADDLIYECGQYKKAEFTSCDECGRA